MSDLKAAALGVMLGWAWADLGEEGGNNSGPFVEKILASLDPPMAPGAAWCAAAVQAAWDVPAEALGVPNPLDAIRREALVADYLEHAQAQGWVAPTDEAEPGDLVIYQFPHGNHIGLLVQPPAPDGLTFVDVSGNTSDEDPRDGEGVEVKDRELNGGYPVTFVNPVRTEWE